jgi:23S rRNA (uracil1939-C5)-methyltransferase
MGRGGAAGCAPLTAVSAATEPVRIERIAAGGDGVGRLEDGRTVFVPRSAPGDLVEAVHIRRERRFARAAVGRVLEPGDGRVDPPCPHYTRDRCGGCQLQHLDPAAQRRARQGIAGDALRRLAALAVTDPPLVPAVAEWSYRSRITLHQGANRQIGFHRQGEAGRVFELEHCHVAAPDLNSLWQHVQAQRGLLPARLDTLTLRRERSGTRHVIVRTPDAAWAGARDFAERMATQDAVTWWEPATGVARIVTSSRSPRHATQFPATVFEQVNPAMGDRVRQYAVDALGDVRGKTGWDLYAGIGEASVMLADRGAQVESVERDARAVDLADRAGTPVRRHALSAEDAVRVLGPAEFVLANPPRVGLAPEVVAAIASRRPARLVYVSCDPATLARDIRRLGPDWRLDAVTAFDLFPQTAHVECVAELRPA